MKWPGLKAEPAAGDPGAVPPFRYAPYQVRRTHASRLIDQGVDLARVRCRLGHGELQATTRYVKILDKRPDSRGRHVGDTSGTLAKLEEPGVRDAIRHPGTLDSRRHGL